MAKVKVIEVVTYDAKYLDVSCKVRYHEDGELNGVEDTDGNMPFLSGEHWQVMIDIDNGVILNWPTGNTAKIHYKVCDQGVYRLLDENQSEIIYYADYVPSIMSPGGNGYGDYIIMSIDENGKIDNWQPHLVREFPSEA